MVSQRQKAVGSRLKNRVSLHPLKGHSRYRWRASFMEGGERKQKYFHTKVDAQAFAEEREAESLNHGIENSLSSAERSAVVESRKRLSDLGLSLRDAINIAADYQEKANRSCSVKELVEEVASTRKRSGQSTKYIFDLRSKLGRFAEAFGNRSVATISNIEIADWLHSLKLSPSSLNSYRRILVVAFNDAVRDGYADSNPAEKVKPSKVNENEVGILTPHELSALLQCADEKIVPAIAIQAFAGIRKAEIERMDWNEVNLAGEIIRVKAAKAKSAQSRLIPISDNLRAWIEPHANRGGLIWPPNGRRLWEAAKKSAGLTSWPNNALRHSFASYYLAQHKNAGELALLMGHSDTKLIFQHYRALVMEHDASAYWGLQPDSVSNVVSMTKIS